MTDYTPMYMTGRCRSGSDQTGQRAHAVPGTLDANAWGWTRAVCGAKPGARGNGWSPYAARAVTCPRCLAALAKRESKVEG